MIRLWIIIILLFILVPLFFFTSLAKGQGVKQINAQTFPQLTVLLEEIETKKEGKPGGRSYLHTKPYKEPKANLYDYWTKEEWQNSCPPIEDDETGCPDPEESTADFLEKLP